MQNHMTIKNFWKLKILLFPEKKFESTNEKFISKRPGKMIHVTIL